MKRRFNFLNSISRNLNFFEISECMGETLNQMHIRKPSDENCYVYSRQLRELYGKLRSLWALAGIARDLIGNASIRLSNIRPSVSISVASICLINDMLIVLVKQATRRCAVIIVDIVGPRFRYYRWMAVNNVNRRGRLSIDVNRVYWRDSNRFIKSRMRVNA